MSSSPSSEDNKSLTASSTLVNVVEHAELRLVRLLVEVGGDQLDAAAFEQACQQCTANGDAPGLIRTMLYTPGVVDALLSIEPLDDAISAFSLLAALLDRVQEQADERRLAEEISTIVMGAVGERQDKAMKCVAMLGSLYNLRTVPAEKCLLLCRLIDLCAAFRATREAYFGLSKPLRELVIDQGDEQLTALLDEWSVVSAVHKRALYRSAAQAIQAVLGEESVQYQRMVLLLIQSYETLEQVDERGVKEARNVAKSAVADPITQFARLRGMLLLPAIKALSKDSPQNKMLYSLLAIFQEGKLEDYQAFCSSHGNVLAELGLKEEDCIRHMRLLSLVSLAAEHEEIPYGAIASTLQVNDGEVEGWVISAVSSGLLQAKMDQLQRLVIVEQCGVRKFGMEQWKSLQERLHTWKKNLHVVLEGLEKQQEQQQEV